MVPQDRSLTSPGHDPQDTDSRLASISVVIPCYRCVDSISHAVKSVYEQTLRPLEVILVNDCSPDATLARLHEEQLAYPQGWIKVISLPLNAGPGTARNAGWAAARGKYIAFLDADDTWRQNKLEVQYNWLESHPDAVLLGQSFKGGEVVEMSKCAVNFTPVTQRMLLRQNYFSTPSVMVRRDVVHRFHEGKRYCEDYQLWCDICFAGNPCYTVDYPLFDVHKPVYGASGLSGQLWRMEVGELAVYRSLLKQGRIGLLTFAVASTWSLAKYGRRVVKSTWRRL